MDRREVFCPGLAQNQTASLQPGLMEVSSAAACFICQAGLILF